MYNKLEAPGGGLPYNIRSSERDNLEPSCWVFSYCVYTIQEILYFLNLVCYFTYAFVGSS